MISRALRACPGDTQFLHLVLQGSTFETQTFRGSAPAGDPSRSGLQRIHDHVALCLFERGDWSDVRRFGRCELPEREAIGKELFFPCRRVGTLNIMLLGAARVRHHPATSIPFLQPSPTSDLPAEGHYCRKACRPLK